MNTPLENPPQPIEDEDSISLLDLAVTISENLKLLIVGPIVAGLVALGVTFLMTPIYTAQTTIQPPPQGTQSATSAAILESLGGVGLASGALGLKDVSQLYIAYMQSNNFEDLLIEKFKLQERYKQKYLVSTRKVLESNVKFTSDKKTGMIKIEVDDPNPKFAAELANAYVAELRIFTGKLALQEAQDRREFLENQIKELSSRQFRDIFTQQALIASMVRQYEAARIDEDKIGPTFTQVDVATIPEFKSKPKRSMIALIASLATGFVLLLSIFIRKAWRNDPHSKEQIGVIESNLRSLWPPFK